MRPRLELTEEDGYAALRAHVTEKAMEARARHGPVIDMAAMRRVLDDRAVVRFPVAVVFDEADLLSGEFARARPRGERPADGFDLVVHPAFEGRDDVLPSLLAYHLPSVNWLDVVGHEEAELFGATLLGLDLDDYYQRLCALVDGLWGSPSSAPAPEVERAGGCGSGSCGCEAAAPPSRDESTACVTSALVAVLDPSRPESEVRARIGLRPCIALGETVDGRLPLTLQKASAAESEQEVGWLAAQPGVLSIEVVFVDLGSSGAIDAVGPAVETVR